MSQRCCGQYSICLQAEHYFLWFCIKNEMKGSYGPFHTATYISTYAMFHSHRWQGSQLYHHGPDPRASPYCLETTGVQAPSLYIPQLCACFVPDGARNESDLNPVFLGPGRTTSSAAWDSLCCRASVHQDGPGMLGTSAAQPCQQMGLVPSHKRPGHGEGWSHCDLWFECCQEPEAHKARLSRSTDAATASS